MKGNKDKVKKTAFCGMMLTLALIAGYVESLIPVAFSIPGIKLGVANSVVLLLVYMVGAKEALAVNITRVFLSGFLFGSMSSILYSISGAALSLAVMVPIKKSRLFSISGVSALGGVFHNAGQLLMAAMVLETTTVVYYFPILLLSGSISGFLMGTLAEAVRKRIGKPM